MSNLEDIILRVREKNKEAILEVLDADFADHDKLRISDRYKYAVKELDFILKLWKDIEGRD